MAPTYVPEGFILKNVQIGNFFGTRITVLNYEDGLNSMLVAYRPSPNIFVSLLAGTFALSLVKKMGDLSYHAPNNYYGGSKGDQLVLASGGLYPEDLQKVAGSLNL